VDPLSQINGWPVPTAAAGWCRVDGTQGRHGPVDRILPLASITKPLVAYAVLIAVEEGSLAFDDEAELPGVTVRHLLAHAGGVDPDRRELIAEPGMRRVYSNAGFEMLGDLLASATGFSVAEYLDEAVLVPLGLASSELRGSPAHGAVSTVADLLVFAAELLAPTLLAPETVAEATTPQFAPIGGILPGFGRQDPNPWGLGFEIRGEKHPHWTGTGNSPRTFGHFGRAGTMLWVDPVAGVATVALTDREFGSWAIEAWQSLSDDVLAGTDNGSLDS
jgi:CubicO group peptidase (beta-lactamase class C family)